MNVTFFCRDVAKAESERPALNIYKHHAIVELHSNCLLYGHIVELTKYKYIYQCVQTMLSNVYG